MNDFYEKNKTIIESIEFKKTEFYFLKSIEEEKIRELKFKNDLSEMRSSVAKLSSLKRKWSAFLIKEITDNAIKEMKTSRSSVQKFQKEVFGKSLSTLSLKKYARRSKSDTNKIELSFKKYEISSMQSIYKNYINVFNERKINLKKSDEIKILKSMRDGSIKNSIK